jgi:hypothetical protein
MHRRPGLGWLAVAIVFTFAVSAGVAVRAADDAPEKASKSADAAAKPADGGAQAPEALLEARGLSRSGSNYILETQEKECFEKFDGIRPLYDKLESRYEKVAAYAMNDAQMQELMAEQAMTQQMMQELSSSGNNMSRYASKYGGRYARYAQNPTQQAQQQLQAEQRALAQQLALMKQQGPTAQQKKEATDQFEKQRAELFESSTEVHDMFTKVQQKYTDLDAEPSVHAALTALRKSAKAQLKIAPSAEFNRKLVQLKKLENMLRPEAASQADSAAPKSKSKGKRSTKMKR